MKVNSELTRFKSSLRVLFRDLFNLILVITSKPLLAHVGP